MYVTSEAVQLFDLEVVLFRMLLFCHNFKIISKQGVDTKYQHRAIVRLKQAVTDL